MSIGDDIVRAVVKGPAGAVLAEVTGPRYGVAVDVAEEVRDVLVEGDIQRLVVEVFPGQEQGGEGG